MRNRRDTPFDFAQGEPFDFAQGERMLLDYAK